MEGYEDDFCYDDDDFEALDREMDQPPPAATLVTASTSSSSSSTSTSTSKHSDKLSNINNIHSKQTDAGRKGIHVEDFSQFDDLPNLTKAVTTRRPSMLTDSSSANQLLLSILPNTVINPDTVAKQEDIEVDSMSQYIIEPEFSVDEVHEAEESKAEKEDLVQTESAVTSQHAANGNDESFFNITKLTALKKKAQAKSFHKDHSPRLAEQQGTAESKEKEKEEVPESTSIPDQVSNKYNNVDIENDSAISKVVVPSNAIAKDPSINAIPTTQSTSKAIKPAPPIQPKPSRLKPVAAVKVHPEKIKNAKRSATEASKHGHVSPSISAASIVTSSESEAKVDVVSSMRQINFQHPSSDTVATNFSADHVDHAMLSEGEKRKVLGAEHDAHISFSLPVIELSQPTLHSHGGSEQDLIPETLQKAVESDAKQKPHPPASHKSEPPGKAAVHKAAPHRKKKQANKVDAVAKEKAKDWIKNPKYRYDEVTGLFSTFETEAQRESRLEVQKQQQLVRQLEREKELEEARLEYAQKLGERKQRRMQRAIPSAKVENTHADQISPRSHVTEKVEALKAMKKIQEDKVAQEKDDLRLRMEYLSQAAFQSKDKYVRNSYQIFGPPVGFKGFQAPPANKSKHPIPSRFVSPPRHGSPVASMQIGLSMESIEGHVHRVDTKASSIGALESQLSLLNSSRRNSHDATYLTEGSTDAEGDSTVINEDIEVSRLKFNPSIVSIQEDIELTVEPVIAPMVTEILEVEVDSGAEGNEEYVDEDFTEAIQVYEDVFDKAHLMHFGEGTIRIKSFYAESPHASGTYKLDLADDAWTLDDAFRKLEEKKSTESYIDEAVEEMSEEERYITKFPVDEEEAELSDGDRYDDTFEGSEQIPLVAEVEPEPNSKPIGDNSFSQDHSVHFEDGPQEMDESHANSSRLKSPPIATNISFTMERTDTADYYDAEDFEVEEDDKISNALAQKIMTKEQNASFHKSSDVFDQPEEIHALSILNQQKNSASRSTKQLNSATRSSSAAYEEEFESYDDEIFEFN